MDKTARPIPQRARPFHKTHKPTPVWLKALLGRELSPTPAEYQAVTDALWKGDPAMDTLVEWMLEDDTQNRKQLIQRAFTHFDNGRPTHPDKIQTFLATLRTPPAWINPELIEQGAHFIHGLGDAAGYVLRDLALMGGYMLSGFNQSLIMTGALNKGTAQRIAETAKWWIDCTEPQGLADFGPGYQTTLQVRLVHSLVRRNLSRRPDWDHSQWGLPLCQIDMVATYLGFSVVMLAGLRKLAIPILPSESRAVIHLWSYACWLMGVEEKWLVQSEAAGFVLLHHTFMTQSKPDASSQELARALAEEPKQRHYPRFQSIRRNLAYRKHLDMSLYFLGRDKMKQLGFDNLGLAWFPITSNAPRAAHYSLHHFIPPLRNRQKKKGRQAQLAMLASMFGDQQHHIINPGSDHPAHTETGI